MFLFSVVLINQREWSRIPVCPRAMLKGLTLHSCVLDVFIYVGFRERVYIYIYIYDKSFEMVICLQQSFIVLM